MVVVKDKFFFFFFFDVLTWHSKKLASLSVSKVVLKFYWPMKSESLGTTALI